MQLNNYLESSALSFPLRICQAPGLMFSVTFLFATTMLLHTHSAVASFPHTLMAETRHNWQRVAHETTWGRGLGLMSLNLRFIARCICIDQRYVNTSAPTPVPASTKRHNYLYTAPGCKLYRSISIPLAPWSPAKRSAGANGHEGMLCFSESSVRDMFETRISSNRIACKLDNTNTNDDQLKEQKRALAQELRQCENSNAFFLFIHCEIARRKASGNYDPEVVEVVKTVHDDGTYSYEKTPQGVR